MPEADWYFDVVSPYAYLQWKTRQKFAGRLVLRPVPVVLGGLLTHWGQKGPAEIDPKRWHTYRDCQWRADQLGVPLKFPPSHPFNSLAAQRLIAALGASEAAVDAVFQAVFDDGRDVSEPATLTELGRKLGLDDVAGAIAAPDVKQRLRTNTEAAIAHGVFGVPTLAVNGELFWGEDSSALLLAWLDDPALFETSATRRLRTLPIGAVRTR